MQFSHTTPWDFYNGDQSFKSPSELHVLEYGHLREIAMGGPLIGSSFLISDEKVNYFIAKYCGGPPLWEKDGKRFAIPIWIKHWFKGWMQRLAVVDIESKKVYLLKRIFDVLHIKAFHQLIIEGVDSPIYYPKMFVIDISKEKICKTWKLERCP
jgi:hypothetical protein